MPSHLLAYVQNIAERDLLVLSLLAGVAGLLVTYITKRRMVGTFAGYGIAQLVAGYFGLLHFRQGMSAFWQGWSTFWFGTGLLVPLLAAFAGSVLVRVTTSSLPKHPEISASPK